MTPVFLWLDLLLLIPALLFWLLRKDLRSAFGCMALLALPFAFTEPLFYPDYWSPPFLFNLGERLGFGIEDLLFVVALAILATGSYPVLWKKRFVPLEPRPRRRLAWPVVFLGLSAIAVALLLAIGMAPIYTALLVMAIAFVVLIVMRRDLLLPGLLGGVACLVWYTLACLVLDLLAPGVFRTVWHTERFLGVFVFGVPLEELGYALSAGLVGSVAYPVLFQRGLNMG